MDGDGSGPLVLIADDEPAVADTYALQLREFETRVAYGGREALEKFDGEVDVVLLDRQMPDLSGDEVLERLREREHDATVIMVTAINPDLDILDMGFDDYIPKPVDKETLVGTIERHVDPPAEESRIEEFFRISSKLELLESEQTEDELKESEEFQRLARRVRELADDLREDVDDFDDLVATHRRIGYEDADARE